MPGLVCKGDGGDGCGYDPVEVERGDDACIEGPAHVPCERGEVLTDPTCKR